MNLTDKAFKALEKLPGYWRGRAETRRQSRYSVESEEYRSDMIRVAEYERRAEQAARFVS